MERVINDILLFVFQQSFRKKGFPEAHARVYLDLVQKIADRKSLGVN